MQRGLLVVVTRGSSSEGQNSEWHDDQLANPEARGRYSGSRMVSIVVNIGFIVHTLNGFAKK